MNNPSKICRILYVLWKLNREFPLSWVSQIIWYINFGTAVVALIFIPIANLIALQMHILISTTSEIHCKLKGPYHWPDSTINKYRTVLQVVILSDDCTPSCKWLTEVTTFYFHPTVQNGNAWFGRGGMWECKPFDEAGDTLHTRSVISPGERKVLFLLIWDFSLHAVQGLRFLWASVSCKLLIYSSLSECKVLRYDIAVKRWVCQIFKVNS